MAQPHKRCPHTRRTTTGIGRQVTSLMAQLEKVSREGAESSPALQAAFSEAVIRTRADLEAAFTALSSAVKLNRYFPAEVRHESRHFPWQISARPI